MSTYIKNYGIAKTIIRDNHYKSNQLIKWMGDYDGKNANIEVDIDNDGSKEFVSMELDNDDLMRLLGVQPVEMSLEKRLYHDFLDKPYVYKPITLEGALMKRRKTQKHRRHNKRHHRRNHYPYSKKRRSYKI
jgi:hypothetical protein